MQPHIFHLTKVAEVDAAQARGVLAPPSLDSQGFAHASYRHQLGRISAFHRVLDSEELWLVHAGRLTVHVIDDGGRHHAHALGLDVAGGERPALSVPRGALQAAELAPGCEYAFGTNVCAPAFAFERSFELCARDALIAALPQHRDLVARLAHAG